MKQILSITRKELESYFGSPLAIIFLGAFLAVILFIFFSVETFFARGIADVRPLFQWIPVLLIFLLAALTMRQWSEEQRSGTMEVLLTLPVKPVQLVLGKFLAVMAMIVLALFLTLPLPLTVSLLGNLDWGPVAGGYLAAILMASAYAAIGLFVSSRTDNQIVALITTVLLGGVFYLVGTRGVTDFFGGTISEILWAIGTGSRFESIERGVIDLRDLIYYLSLASAFLLFNTISVDSIRWSKKQKKYRESMLFTTVLITLNLILLNAWLYPLQGLRVDMTEQKEYTLSQASLDLLDSIQEPLVIRAFISEKTHPLLQPLVPQISDLLREYEIRSAGMVSAEVIDPLSDPELEAEANQTYGIRPTPFQVTGRYEASVINSYFDILIRYGDQSVVLNFSDLIEIEPRNDGIDVRLRNLEYDLTRGIKKVLFGFQSVDAVLAELDEPAYLTLFVTPDMLPPELGESEQVITRVANEIATQSNGKFIFSVINPDAPGSEVDRQTLIDQYGLQPFPVALFSTDSYYLHMILSQGEQAQLIYPPSQITDGEVRTEIESALKRTSSGFLKVVGLWTPPEIPTQDAFGQAQPPISTYRTIAEQLRSEYNVSQVDLSTGKVPSDIDVLVIVAPQNLTEKDLFTIDQFLMRGGSVVIAASNYTLDVDQFTGTLVLAPLQGGLSDLLEHYGINLSQSIVMDAQNEAFPITIPRDVGGVQVQEIQAIDYPFFVDVRTDGMNTDSLITTGMQAVTLNWASPVKFDETRNANRDIQVILNSSAFSWLRAETDIQPDFELYPELGFEVPEELGSYPLAVSIQGEFDSYFSDRESPFAVEEPAADMFTEAGPLDNQPEADTENGPIATIERSPASSRLVVIGSAAFVDDFVLELSSRLSQDRYLNNLRFLQNAVDWTVEDLDLLTIRARGSATRVLLPMGEQGETFWEIVNYIVVLAALLGIYIFWQLRKHNEKPMELVPVQAGDE
jgi:ABC-2 type transport system permease protein